MSYAGQQIDYAIVSKKNVSELEFLKLYGKLTDMDVVLDSFRYFKKHHLISDTFFYPHGHVVMAEFKKGTNMIVKKKNIKEPVINENIYKIDFFEIMNFEDKEYEIKVYSINVAASEKDIQIFAHEFEDELKNYIKKIKFVISCLN